MKLETSIKELHEMFMDIAVLVEQQGEVVNRYLLRISSINTDSHCNVTTSMAVLILFKCNHWSIIQDWRARGQRCWVHNPGLRWHQESSWIPAKGSQVRIILAEQWCHIQWCHMQWCAGRRSWWSSACWSVHPWEPGWASNTSELCKAGEKEVPHKTIYQN